jgi:aminopeptidase-like protein
MEVSKRRNLERSLDFVSLLPSSLCNDNLSGVALATYLAKHFTALSLDIHVDFHIPGTIGSITWLSERG